MITRRAALAGLACVPVGARLLGLRAYAQTGAVQFDYYISPSGSDSNSGSAAQPWAITAINTQQAKYAGKRVGLMDGTYNVSSLGAHGNNYVKLAVASGPDAGNPTIIQAVNPRAAILTSKSGGSYSGTAIIGSGANGLGVNPRIQYITIKDLLITGSSTIGISFAADSGPKSCPGLVIDGCEISDIVNFTNGNSNYGGIVLGTGPQGCIIQNCLIHDCWQSGIPRNQHGNASGIYDWGNDTIIQNCTIYDCNNHLYQKNQGANPPPQGATIRNNYFWYGNSGSAVVFAGYNNATGTSPPYDPTNIYNNVIENVQVYYNANDGVDGLQANVNFYNNTVYSSGTGNLGYWIPTAAAYAAGVRVSVYNNILVRTALDSARGDLTLGPVYGAWRICDYNCYPSAPRFGISSADSVYPTGLVALTQWISVSGAPDRHSLASDPMFSAAPKAGGGAQQYQLAASSPCRGAGRITGTGSQAIDIGAWGGASSIGHNFGATPATKIPDPPQLTGVS